MRGKLYGVGVGPGDPELLTLKAVRILKEADVIAVPAASAEESVAYRIAKGAYEAIEEKEILPVPMPMTKDKEKFLQSHEEGTEHVREQLDAGRSVAFIVLGEPTIYSTYTYIHKRILKMGYEAEIVNGVPSFCAAASKLNISLVEQDQPLHIIPASYQVQDALHLPGTKVLMKAGKQIGTVKEQILASGAEGMMIENCGMPGEHIYRTIGEIPDTAGYYSLIIIKEKEE